MRPEDRAVLNKVVMKILPAMNRADIVVPCTAHNAQSILDSKKFDGPYIHIPISGRDFDFKEKDDKVYVQLKSTNLDASGLRFYVTKVDSSVPIPTDSQYCPIELESVEIMRHWITEYWIFAFNTITREVFYPSKRVSKGSEYIAEKPHLIDSPDYTGQIYIDRIDVLINSLLMNSLPRNNGSIYKSLVELSYPIVVKFKRKGVWLDS